MTVYEVENTIKTLLPPVEEINQTGTWRLPVKNGKETVEFFGKFLGMATTHQEEHNERAHEDASFKCSACRWFEPRIFLDTEAEPNMYIVHLAYMTTVPGEIEKSKIEKTPSANEVMEILTSRNRTGQIFLSQPARRVLSQATKFDQEILDAWINRALA